MDKMLYLSMTGAKNVMLQQATTAHNMANVHTHGYKRDFPVFRALPVVGQGAPTRITVTDSTIGHDMRPGTLNYTGNPTDFAIATPGLVAVAADDGEEAYTRQGGLLPGADGILRNYEGRAYMGDGGGPIAVPPNARLYLQEDGRILASDPVVGGDGDPQEIGQLRLINPPHRALYKGPDGLFRVSDATPAQEAPEQLLLNPVRVVAGYLENSNVNAADAMVQMINHARQFELNVRMMQTADQNARTATQLLSIER